MTLACSSSEKPDPVLTGASGAGPLEVSVGGTTTTQASGGTGVAPLPSSGGADTGMGGTGVGGTGVGGTGVGGTGMGGAGTGGGTTFHACDTNNGGCDLLVTCTNSVGGARTCGACPPGYVGTGEATCIPTLSTLTLSKGVLSPELNGDVTLYATTVGLGSQTITLTPTAPAGATITINGQTVVSGTSWTSPTLNLGANAITVVISQLGRPSRNYQLTVNRGMDQQAYIKASNTNQDDSLGWSVALSSDGSTLAVGSWYEDSGSPGINGDQADNSVQYSGAVYVFTRSGNAWSQQAYIKASNPDVDDRFGVPVALSADGGTLAVGSPLEDSNATGINGDQADNSAHDSGAVYVFTRSGSSWSQQAYVKAPIASSQAYFGAAIALSGDGSTMAVGAWLDDLIGAAYVFTRLGGVWGQEAKVTASNPDADDHFGLAVALSGDGNTLAVGANGEASSATGLNGDQLDNGSYFSGAVYIFSRSGSLWSQQAYLKASNTNATAEFGCSVALSADGGTLAVGALGEDSDARGINGNQASTSAQDSGAVYVFARSGNSWRQEAYIKASNADTFEEFGIAIALSGDGGILVVGAPSESSNAAGVNGNQTDDSIQGSGAVYLFTRLRDVWSQQAYVKASNTDAWDSFGIAVALSGDGGTLAVGAFGESSSATGVNGNQTDNSMQNSGAAYVFR
ncbi:MAG: cadherin-like beta sandwich domain-containing protein [Polyangiaceae bacterium]|nr:cadherin-like beta sandwich domain-containing protein [Polyangiaceae bacterium]